MTPAGDVPGEGRDSEDVWRELLAQADRPDDEYDEDRAFVLIQVLQYRAEPRYVDLALPLLEDAVPGRRQMAAWLLGQYGYQEGRPYGDRVALALAAAARVEADNDTRDSLITALGFTRTLPAELARHAGDPYTPVRLAVARSLPSAFVEEMDDAAVAVMISLTTDDDPEVRDWATFGLGTLSQLDSPAIRAALTARLDDDGGDTKFEALLVLALRGDLSVLPRLRGRLENPGENGVFKLDLEAAEALADPSLAPVLDDLCRLWVDETDTEFLDLASAALERCDPAHHAAAVTLERQLTEAVNARLAGSGLAVTLSGTYPRTSGRLTGPHGELVDLGGEWLVWEGMTVTGFDADRGSDQWTYNIRLRLAADPVTAPPP